MHMERMHKLFWGFHALLLVALVLNLVVINASGVSLYPSVLCVFSFGILSLLFLLWDIDPKKNWRPLLVIFCISVCIQLIKNPIGAHFANWLDLSMKHYRPEDFYDSLLHLPGQNSVISGQNSVIFIPPLIPFLVLLFWAIKQAPRAFLGAFVYLFVLFYIGRLVFPHPTAAMDNKLYLLYAFKNHNVWDALLSRHFNTSPVADMLYLGISIFHSMAIAVAFLHALYVSGILVLAAKFFDVDFAKAGLMKVLALCTIVFIASPVMSIMAIMINKDFVITLSLFALLLAVKRGFEEWRTRKRVAVAQYMLFIFCAGLVIFCARPQLFYFLVLASLLLWVYRALQKFEFTAFVRWAVIIGIISIGMATLLFWKWHIIRVEIPFFFDGTNIADYHFIAFARDPKSFFMAFAYVWIGWFFGFFGGWVNLYLHVSLVYLALAHLFFLMMLLIFVRQSKASLLKAFFLIFLLLHFAIQIWATPNIWIMMRQTLFEFFFLMVYTYSVFLKQSSFKPTRASA